MVRPGTNSLAGTLKLATPLAMQAASLTLTSSIGLIFAFLIHLPIVSTQTTASPTELPPHPPFYQPLLDPNHSSLLTPGAPFLIQWTPNHNFSNITLELWDRTSWGYSRDFGSGCYHYMNPFCGTIASHAPNTGSFEWQIPIPANGFPKGEANKVFWIKVYVNDWLKEDIGSNDPVVSYSEAFAFAAEPGQEVPVLPSSTETSVTSTMIVDTSLETTTGVPRTSAGTMGVETTTAADALPTYAPGKNNTALASGRGATWRSKRTIPSSFLLLIGFI